ncbi:hypothetical protein NHQ30_008823 [Ciborinia camelliae]|nr:hypothetical protein NHQ30_008823 [Ciborinia camelliae]
MSVADGTSVFPTNSANSTFPSSSKSTSTKSSKSIILSTEFSSTVTGSSVQGIATAKSVTSVCTASSCMSGCIPGPTHGTNVPPYTTPEPVITDLDLRRHQIASRVPLDKRGATSDILSLGGCAMTTSLTRPAWPAITKDIMSPDNAGNLPTRFKALSRYDRATNVGCVFTTTRLNVAAFTNAPTFTDYSGKLFKNNNDGSLDHAYEKAWLKQFFDTTFKSQIGAGKITCPQINQFFFPTGHKLLQPVFDGLGSNINLDFIIMSQYINGWKSIFFPEAGGSFPQQFLTPDWLIPSTGGDAGWKWPSGNSNTQYSAKDALAIMLSYFEKVLYGTLEMKTDNMFKMIDKTNNQIYGQLLNAHVEVLKQPNTAAYKAAFPGVDGIASSYKDFITTTILPQINEPPKYLTKLWKNTILPDVANAKKLKDVGTDPANPNNPGKYLPEWTKIDNLVAAHEKHYYSSGKYSWDYSFAFTWVAVRAPLQTSSVPVPVTSTSPSTSM